MSDLSVLASLKWAELRNRVRLLGKQSRFKFLVIAAFSVGFWFFLYRLFFFGLRFLHLVAVGYGFDAIIDAMFYVFFFALMVMLTFSNAIIGYGSFYRSKETEFLLTTPVRPENVFLYKFTEGLAFSSWAFLFLGTPLLAAYGRLFHASWHFYAGSAAYLAAFMFLPAIAGAIIAMIVTVYIPRTRRGLVVGVALGTLLLIVALVFKILAFRGPASGDLKLASEVFESTSFTRIPLLPSYWLSKGILALASPNASGSVFFLGLISSTALFFLAVAHAAGGRLMMRGWQVAQGLRSAARYPGRGAIDRVLSAVLWFVDPRTRLIVIKDVKSFVRDPIQWSQFLIFFGLLAIYFTNLRTFAYEERDMFWKNLIAQMNLLATSLTLSTFASRFIYPQLSLEGRRFWIMGMAPMDRERILLAKMALSFFCSLAISETLITISSVMLRTPPAMAILHAVTLFGVCLGLSGLAVGLGTLYPNFSEDNPSKIVSGFGGTLNLVLSLAFVLAALGAQAVPCFIYYGGGFPAGMSLRVVAALSMVGILGISLAACLIPMSMGLRAFRRLEI